MLPEGAEDGYLAMWRQQQARHRQSIDEAFSPLPIREAPYFEQEVFGLPMLRRLGEAIFAEDDPSAFFSRGRPYEVVKAGNSYRLEMALPFMSKEQVTAKRLGEELLLQVGNYRRTLVLPRVLVDLSIESAAMQDSRLTIAFGGKRDGTA
jgi:arsenite-transporting ATPase